jgi:5,10-methylenetetrahydrofolate reductase
MPLAGTLKECHALAIKHIAANLGGDPPDGEKQ